MGLSQPGTSRAPLRAYAFVDGGYLREDLEDAWQEIAVWRLVEKIPWSRGPRPEIVRTFLYDAPADSDVELWLDRNEREVDTRVVRGAVSRGKSRRQLGVDVALTADALYYGIRGHFDAAFILSGDGDFVPLASRLTEIGPRVFAVGWTKSLNKDLLGVVDRVEYFPSLDSVGWADIARGIDLPPLPSAGANAARSAL